MYFFSCPYHIKCHVSSSSLVKIKRQQTCNSILALSFVFLAICLRLISAPVRVAFPEELQSPMYVGRPGVPINYNTRKEGTKVLLKNK